MMLKLLAILGVGFVVLAAGGCGNTGSSTTDYTPPVVSVPMGIEVKQNVPGGLPEQNMTVKSSVWEGRVRGIVLDADYVTDTVLIDKGFGDILGKWMFEVHRGSESGQLVGLIEVDRIRSGLSSCKVIESTLPIKPGDIVVSK